MPGRIFVIGASVSGISTLSALVSRLPATLPAVILVVQHTSPDGPGLLHEILGREGRLPACRAREGQRVEPGCIYVAPPDHHLLVRQDHTLHLSRGPKENCTRPAVDPTMRSAALAYGPQAVGIVLTGYLDDGTAGLLAIKDRGGVAIVQDPLEATVPSMPRSALRHVPVDHCVAVADMASVMVTLAADGPGPDPGVPPTLELEARLADGPLDAGAWQLLAQRCRPAGLECPDCRSALYDMGDPRLPHYRCRSGHAFGVLSLLSAQAEERDRLLSASQGALLEEALLARRVAGERADADAPLAAALHERAQRLQQQAAQIAVWLAAGGPSTE